MQNIDILFVLQPIVIITTASALMIYWHRKRGFHLSVFMYTFVAYAVAIAFKETVQLPTITAVVDYFGPHSVGLGIYYGLQTVFFEVGLAFLIAWYAVSHRKLDVKDAEAYGSGLAF
jgi:hypothetical protein